MFLRVTERREEHGKREERTPELARSQKTFPLSGPFPKQGKCVCMAAQFKPLQSTRLPQQNSQRGRRLSC